MNEQRLKEQIEVLAGARASNKRQSAVRVQQLEPLLQIPQMQAQKAAGAPTQAEYDALQADVAALHARLREVSDLLRDVLLP